MNDCLQCGSQTLSSLKELCYSCDYYYRSTNSISFMSPEDHHNDCDMATNPTCTECNCDILG